MYEQWYLSVIFLSVGLRIWFLLLQIEMQYNQVDTFTMMTFLLGNMIGVKKQISFKTTLLCNVSFPHVLGNISWKLNHPP